MFNSGSFSWGKSAIMDWSELIKPENGYIINGKLKLEGKIEASPLQYVDNNEWLKMETIWKCCDDSFDGKYRLKINKFHDFSMVRSNEFIQHRIPWQLMVFRNQTYGSKQDHISIKLHCNLDSNENFLCDVTIICKVIEKTNPEIKEKK